MAAPLDDGEWLALGGLLRAMMRADGKISIREHRMVAELVQALGPKLWESLAYAERELTSEALVFAQAERVRRPASRAIIRDAIVRMAGSDGIAGEEQALLDRLDALWAASR